MKTLLLILVLAVSAQAELPMKIDTVHHYSPFIPEMDIYIVHDFCSGNAAKESLRNHCFRWGLYYDTTDIYITIDTTYRLTAEQVGWLSYFNVPTADTLPTDSLRIEYMQGSSWDGLLYIKYVDSVHKISPDRE